ncbi:hypothetical protein OC844_000922 [Tilletia horrida]|nr:hypothetical protein OC844_000922 [Tilletia horrida]
MPPLDLRQAVNSSALSSADPWNDALTPPILSLSTRPLLPAEQIVNALPAWVKLGASIHNFNNAACTIVVIFAGLLAGLCAFWLREERAFSRTNDLLFLHMALMALSAILDLSQRAITHSEPGRQVVAMGILSALSVATATFVLALWIWWVAEGDAAVASGSERAVVRTATYELSGSRLQRQITGKSNVSSIEHLAHGSISTASSDREAKEKDKDRDGDNGSSVSPSVSMDQRSPQLTYDVTHARYHSTQSSFRSNAVRSASHRASRLLEHQNGRAQKSFYTRFRSPWAHFFVVLQVYIWALTVAAYRSFILFESTAAVAKVIQRVSLGLAFVMFVIFNSIVAARLHQGLALGTTGAQEHMRCDSHVRLSSGVSRLERQAKQALIVLTLGNGIGMLDCMMTEILLGYIMAPMGRVMFTLQMLCYLFTAVRTALITSEYCGRPRFIHLHPLDAFRFQHDSVQPGVCQDVVVSCSGGPASCLTPDTPARARLRDDPTDERRLSTIVSVDDRRSLSTPPQSVRRPRSPSIGGLTSPSGNFRSLWSRDSRTSLLRRNRDDGFFSLSRRHSSSHQHQHLDAKPHGDGEHRTSPTSASSKKKKRLSRRKSTPARTTVPSSTTELVGDVGGGTSCSHDSLDSQGSSMADVKTGGAFRRSRKGQDKISSSATAHGSPSRGKKNRSSGGSGGEEDDTNVPLDLEGQTCPQSGMGAWDERFDVPNSQRVRLTGSTPCLSPHDVSAQQTRP